LLFSKNAANDIPNLCCPTLVVEKIKSADLHCFLYELGLQFLFAHYEEHGGIAFYERLEQLYVFVWMRL